MARDGTYVTRMEELLRRLEVITIRLESVGLTPPTDPKAVEAADKYVELRRFQIHGPSLGEPDEVASEA